MVKGVGKSFLTEEIRLTIWVKTAHEMRMPIVFIYHLIENSYFTKEVNKYIFLLIE